MIFFDTNVLVYFSINQNMEKQALADERIQDALAENKFVISPLVMVEYIFVLAKLKQVEYQGETVSFFQTYVKGSIDGDDVRDAYELCSAINGCKNINDAIHLKYAERHCEKIITFDKDFNRLGPHASIAIEVLS